MKIKAYAHISDASLLVKQKNVARCDKLGDDSRMVVKVRFGMLPPFEDLDCWVRSDGKPASCDLGSDQEGPFVDVVVEGGTAAVSLFLVDVQAG